MPRESMPWGIRKVVSVSERLAAEGYAGRRMAARFDTVALATQASLELAETIMP